MMDDGRNTGQASGSSGTEVAESESKSSGCVV